MEIWKDIEGFEGYYQISNYGRLKSLQRFVPINRGQRIVRERIIKIHIGSCGYYQHPLNVKSLNKRKTILIHREVAKMFVPNPSPQLYTEVNHIDENKLNNHYSNLEWCDRSYNNVYGTRKQRIIITQRNSHPRRKQVYQFNKKGELIAVFQSTREAERSTNICHNNISQCVNGQRKTAGGFIWKMTK